MSRKTCILTLAVGGVCAFAVSSAFAQTVTVPPSPPAAAGTPGILPGNVLPNPDLSVAAPAGPDPVTSQWGTSYGPYTEDSNPRPLNWHRGGADWGVQGPPTMEFWNPTQGDASPTPPPSGTALEINDGAVNNSGEWFTAIDGSNLWNTLPADSIANGLATIQLSWEYTNVTDDPTDVKSGGGNFRVTVNYGVAGATLFSGGFVGPSSNFLIAAGTSPNTVNQDTWETIDETLNIPAGDSTFEVTIDSGGNANDTGQIWVDDISVSSVPEPTCIAGITAGSMLLLARRRRRA